MGRDKLPATPAPRGAEHPDGEPPVVVVDEYEIRVYKAPNGIRTWSLKRPKRVASGVVLEYQIEEPSEETRSWTFHTIAEVQGAVRKILSRREQRASRCGLSVTNPDLPFPRRGGDRTSPRRSFSRRLKDHR